VARAVAPPLMLQCSNAWADRTADGGRDQTVHRRKVAARREAEALLDELAEVVRQISRDHREAKVAMLPAAGNA
jgi:hypothetical protein